jgi:NTP pyrophosphatase (non-canonical NTP hydrolase)
VIKHLPAFQQFAKEWLVGIVGEARANDTTERSYRFIEEALELVHTQGISLEDVVTLAAYVYLKPPASHEARSEVGDVQFTLAALCNAIGADTAVTQSDVVEKMKRKREAIAEKMAAYKGGPLPGGAELSEAWETSRKATLAPLSQRLRVAFRTVADMRVDHATETKKNLDNIRALERRVADLQANSENHWATLDAKNLELEEMANLLAEQGLKKRAGEDAAKIAVDGGAAVNVYSTQGGHVGFVTGDPARLVTKDAEPMPDGIPTDGVREYILRELADISRRISRLEAR